MVTPDLPAIEVDPVPRRKLHVALLRRLARPLPDRLYLRLAHWLYFNRWPDFEHPRDLQEHIQAYVLRTRDPALVMLADKLASRDYIARTLGDEYNVPLIGSWTHEDEVPLATLPYPVVLKPAHLSGKVLMLSSYRREEEAKQRAKMRAWLRREHSRLSREWFYARVPRRVLAEPLLRDASGGVPADFKTYVVGGRVRFFQVDHGRFGRATRNLYDLDWSLLPARTILPRHPPEPPPHDLPRLIEIAERVAAPFEFMRVDFYLLGERVLVGELTSSPAAGFGRYYPASFSEQMAAHWVPGRRGAHVGVAPATNETNASGAEALATAFSAKDRQPG
jgi:hypothetical protein